MYSKKYSDWDYYEIVEGFRIYRDELCTGDGLHHKQLGEICKTRTEAYAICALKNLQNNGGN